MSSQRDYIVYLDDMIEAVKKGISFTRGVSYKQFCADEKTQYTVVRAIEIVGEASKKIPQKVKEKYIDIPWRQISGMRDKLIHDYFGVDIQVVWKTVKEDFPFLKKLLKNLLTEINK